MEAALLGKRGSPFKAKLKKSNYYNTISFVRIVFLLCND